MRINGFEQIKALYSMVFNQECNFTPQHISLYVFLVNQNNRNNWVEWFKCPFDLGMAGSCIGNKKTYYKCLNELQGWGLLTYEKGENAWKAPKIRLEVLNRTSSETATVPQAEPLLQQLGTPLPTHNIKPVTSNHKQETERVGKPDDGSDVACIIDEINKLAGTSFRPQTKESRKYIQARLQEHGLEAALKVVRQKAHDWLNDEKMKPHFVPVTLFREANFEKYLQASNTAAATPSGPDHRNNPDFKLGAKRYRPLAEFSTKDQYIKNCQQYGHTPSEA